MRVKSKLILYINEFDIEKTKTINLVITVYFKKTLYAFYKIK